MAQCFDVSCSFILRNMEGGFSNPPFNRGQGCPRSQRGGVLFRSIRPGYSPFAASIWATNRTVRVAHLTKTLRALRVLGGVSELFSVPRKDE